MKGVLPLGHQQHAVIVPVHFESATQSVDSGVAFQELLVTLLLRHEQQRRVKEILVIKDIGYKVFVVVAAFLVVAVVVMG